MCVGGGGGGGGSICNANNLIAQSTDSECRELKKKVCLSDDV